MNDLGQLKWKMYASVSGLIGLGLAWYWYGWRLIIVLLIVLWGNNIEQRVKLFTFLKKLVETAKAGNS